MASFDFAGTGYCFDTSPGRIIYFYHIPCKCGNVRYNLAVHVRDKKKKDEDKLIIS
ncbi:hypothetical protein [Ruminiclostridium cellulolyticum]|uniref:hypothetical protein n=1 Tax=Ruminiclostridium cellulolyticum TaxID=1521 RepID=UPI0000E96F09|nr:hypothetical protein [Ruminiclostridium cellulolyticum]